MPEDARHRGLLSCLSEDVMFKRDHPRAGGPGESRMRGGEKSRRSIRSRCMPCTAHRGWTAQRLRLY